MQENQKVIAVYAIVVVIITITVSAFTWYIAQNHYRNSDPSQHKPLSQTSQTADTEMEWTEINHVTFWNNPSKINGDYSFPDIAFSYPSNWHFSCCLDVDDRSMHRVYATKSQDPALPYIEITNYSLNGCPTHQPLCSIDQIITKSPAQKFDELLAQIAPQNIMSDRADTAISTRALQYKKTPSAHAYLLLTASGVMEISFYNFTDANQNLIEIFLQKLKNNESPVTTKQFVNRELGIAFSCKQAGSCSQLTVHNTKIIDAQNAYIEIFDIAPNQTIEQKMFSLINANGGTASRCTVTNNGPLPGNEKLRSYSINLVDHNITYTPEESVQIAQADDEAAHDGGPFNGEWKKKEIYDQRLIQACSLYADPVTQGTAKTSPSHFISDGQKLIFIPGSRDEIFLDETTLEIIK